MYNILSTPLPGMELISAEIYIHLRMYLEQSLLKILVLTSGLCSDHGKEAWLHSFQLGNVLNSGTFLLCLWEYCDEYVCLSVWLSVCPVSYLENRTVTPHQIFVFLACGNARSSSDGVALCFVLPVLWMTSCFTYGAPCLFLSGDRIRQSNSRNSKQILLSDIDQQVFIMSCTWGDACYLRLPYFGNCGLAMGRTLQESELCRCLNSVPVSWTDHSLT